MLTSLFAVVAVFPLSVAVAQQPQCADAARQVMLSGMVRDSSNGLPVAAATVIALLPSPNTTQAQQQVQTTASGRFILCLPATATLHLYATHDGRISHPRRVNTSARQAAAGLTLWLTRFAGARVIGRVLEAGTNRGLRDVSLRLEPLGLAQTSDAGGRFTFSAVPPGPYVLRAEHAVLQPRSDSLTVVAGGSDVDVTVSLADAAATLEPIVVRALSQRLSRTGFYERQRSGAGVFLSRDDIEKMSGISATTDIIRKLRGVQLVRRPNARGSRVVGRNMCPYRYFVDDVRVGPTFELDDLPWRGIEGIEIYNGIGAIPARYSSMLANEPRSCGVVVIWTRVR